MTRIDAAIRRIEAAVNRRAQETAALRQRYEVLREEVAAAIAEIDDLVAKDTR